MIIQSVSDHLKTADYYIIHNKSIKFINSNNSKRLELRVTL